MNKSIKVLDPPDFLFRIISARIPFQNAYTFKHKNLSLQYQYSQDNLDPDYCLTQLP